MNLLRVLDLDRPAFEAVLACAKDMKAEPHRHLGALERETIVGVFARPSTRTRLAFAAAAQRLGLFPFFVDATGLQLARGEGLADTARSLSSYAALIIARLPSHDDLEALAESATVPVVNALSDRHHPCEAIASLFTLRDHFGSLDGLRLAYVGDGNNVAHSLIEAAALTGLAVAIASPPQHAPNATVVAEARRIAATTGGEITVGEDPDAAVRGTNAVFTDVWTSMGSEAEAGERRRQFAEYQVDARLIGLAADDAVFIHSLPAHRGEEVAADVLDGPQSLVWAQVANHLYIAQALMWTLIRGRQRRL
jgi:ornithine carbamoyltransferase